MRPQILEVRELRKQRGLVTGSHLLGRAQSIAPLRAMNVNMNVNVNVNMNVNVNVNMNINVNINVNDYNRGGDFEGLKLKM